MRLSTQSGLVSIYYFPPSAQLLTLSTGRLMAGSTGRKKTIRSFVNYYITSSLPFLPGIRKTERLRGLIGEIRYLIGAQEVRRNKESGVPSSSLRPSLAKRLDSSNKDLLSTRPVRCAFMRSSVVFRDVSSGGGGSDA